MPWRRWSPWCLLSFIGLAACSGGESRHVAVAYTPGREAIIVETGADFEAGGTFAGADLAFVQRWDDRRTRLVPGFVDDPLASGRAARSIEADVAYRFVAATDAEDRICLVQLRYDANSSIVTASVSEDRGGSWSPPGIVYREGGELVRVDPDALAPGVGGEWYFLVRYWLGRIPKGLLFRVYRGVSSRWELRGTVPGSDDLSVSDQASLAVSADGRVGLVFVNDAGQLRVMESVDGGRTWANLGAPGKPWVPGFRIPFIGATPKITERMPALRWIDGGWGVVWDAHVAIRAGALAWDNYVDTVFSRHDRTTGTWTRPLSVNDRRTIVRTTGDIIAGGGMAHMELLHREARGTEFRFPQLVVAPTGRLAILWTELRDGRLVPVASISDDRGRSWSAAIVLDRSHAGDTDRVRGAFDRNGTALRAIYVTWPGRTTLVVPTGLRLKVSEVLLP